MDTVLRLEGGGFFIIFFFFSNNIYMYIHNISLGEMLSTCYHAYSNFSSFALWTVPIGSK